MCAINKQLSHPNNHAGHTQATWCTCFATLTIRAMKILTMAPIQDHYSNFSVPKISPGYARTKLTIHQVIS